MQKIAFDVAFDGIRWIGVSKKDGVWLYRQFGPSNMPVFIKVLSAQEVEEFQTDPNLPPRPETD